MENSGNPKRRRATATILISLIIASALIFIGRVGAQTVAPELGFLLIEPGADVDGIHVSFIEKADRKVVSLSGFIGSPTIYSEPLRLCNVGDRKLNLQLETRDATEGWWSHSVLRIWLVRLDGRRSLLLSLPLFITGTPIELKPGECARMEVEVLVPAYVSAGETASFTISFTEA